jgi:hypothetical protein
MTNLEKIKATLAEARATAGAAMPAVANSNVPATSAAPGRAVTTRELLAQGGQMQVKMYLKVEKLAFLLSKDTSGALFKEFDVEFRLSEVMPFFGLRYGASPAKYERSLDRQVNSRNGRSWADCIAEAQRLDPRCRGDYASVDIPFTMVKEVKGVLDAGDKIGWTSSITNFKVFKDFVSPFYELIDAGAMSEDALVRGKIVHEKKKGGENEYGALTFVGFDVVSEEVQAAA